MIKLLFATGNKGKMKEIREILADLPFEIYSLSEAGISADIEENGSTFEENAVIKVKAVREALSHGDFQVILSDDSGLEVDALDKAPGVHSSRFMGEDTSYHVKNAELIRLVNALPEKPRTCRFRCVIAAILPDGEILTTSGAVEGEVAYEEKGGTGFGYDPIFYLPERKCTMAELTQEEKNALSHRGRALRAMKEILKDKLRLDSKEA